MPISSDHTIPALGEPSAELPEWGSVVRSFETTFILHPPVNIEIAYRMARYIVFLAFSSATTDLSIGDAPMQRTRIRAGSAMFVEAGTCVRVLQYEPVEFLVFAVEPAHVQAVGNRASAGRLWHVHTALDVLDPGISAVALEIRRAMLADPMAEPTYLQALADAILARFVCRFLSEGERVRDGEALSPGILARVVRHIDAHLGETLRVNDLATLVGLSRSHFTRAFQRMTGDPPLRFVLKRRVCRARDLISASAESLAHVAAQTGFASQAHLSTVFRKELGTTPARYRDAFEAGRQPERGAPTTSVVK